MEIMDQQEEGKRSSCHRKTGWKSAPVLSQNKYPRAPSRQDAKTDLREARSEMRDARSERRACVMDEEWGNGDETRQTAQVAKNALGDLLPQA